MFRTLSLTLTAAALLAAQGAHAEAFSGADSYISVGYFYTDPDKARRTEYGNGFTGLYAGRLSPSRWWEVKLFETVFETGSQTAIDFYQTGLGLDLIQSLSDESSGHVFLVGGAGIVLNQVKPDSKNGKSFDFNVGAGWRFGEWQAWGMRPRLEVRYVYDTFDGGQQDLVAGIKMEFGARTVHVVDKVVTVEKIKTVEEPVEIERIVEKGAVCVAAAAPVVTDVPEPAPVVAMVEPDSDGDGVPDSRDKCPNTIKGAKVDASGCVAQAQTINMPNVEFELGKANLTADGMEALDPVVAFLKSQSAVQLDVLGHTDNKGSPKANQALSENRAKAVVEYFVSQGVDEGRLSSKGFGASQPIATNKTDKGRAKNRRVEIRIRTEEGKP